MGVEVCEDKDAAKPGTLDLPRPSALSEGTRRSFTFPSMGLASGCSRSHPSPAERLQDITYTLWTSAPSLVRAMAAAPVPASSGGCQVPSVGTDTLELGTNNRRARRVL